MKNLTPSSGPHGCHQGCADFPEWEKSRIFRPRYHADVRSCGKAHPICFVKRLLIFIIENKIIGKATVRQVVVGENILVLISLSFR